MSCLFKQAHQSNGSGADMFFYINSLLEYDGCGFGFFLFETLRTSKVLPFVRIKYMISVCNFDNFPGSFCFRLICQFFFFIRLRVVFFSPSGGKRDLYIILMYFAEPFFHTSRGSMVKRLPGFLAKSEN